MRAQLLDLGTCDVELGSVPLGRLLVHVALEQRLLVGHAGVVDLAEQWHHEPLAQPRDLGAGGVQLGEYQVPAVGDVPAVVDPGRVQQHVPCLGQVHHVSSSVVGSSD